MKRRDFIRMAIGVGVTLPFMGRERNFAAEADTMTIEMEDLKLSGFINGEYVSRDLPNQTIKLFGWNSDGEQVSETLEIPADGKPIVSKTVWSSDDLAGVTVHVIDQPSYVSGVINLKMRME